VRSIILSLTILGILSAAVLTACNSKDRTSLASPSAVASPSVTAAPPADNIRRITPAELKDLLAKDQAVVIDVRNQASYDQGHVKGAKLIPAAEILNHVNELPRNKLIVTYCS